jgi:polyisoprenoid-binding protein YceI
MRKSKEGILGLLIVIFSIVGYVVGCTHDDEILASSGSDITRGEQKLTLTNPKHTFDKAHSNVQWSTAYLGATSLLTGRFDNFGVTSFDFDESNAAGIQFEAWVWLNTVNTSEPARDDGCLLSTFGTDGSLTTEAENQAIIKSKSVTLSTTDKGYDVKADLTFHGATHEVVCKLSYAGKTLSGTSEVLGFGLEFSMLAKTDFGISSTNIGDNVTVKVNTNFKIAP